MKKYITKKTISIAGGLLVLGGLGLFGWYFYQMVQVVKFNNTVIHQLLDADKDGVTNFDRLVVQTISKAQQAK